MLAAPAAPGLMETEHWSGPLSRCSDSWSRRSRGNLVHFPCRRRLQSRRAGPSHARAVRSADTPPLHAEQNFRRSSPKAVYLAVLRLRLPADPNLEWHMDHYHSPRGVADLTPTLLHKSVSAAYSFSRYPAR